MTNLENFSIYENGDLVTEPLAVQAVHVAGNLAISALQATYSASKRVLGECATHLQLDIADARLGTHMRAEYIAQKKQLATAALREEMGL